MYDRVLDKSPSVLRDRESGKTEKVIYRVGLKSESASRIFSVAFSHLHVHSLFRSQ